MIKYFWKMWPNFLVSMMMVMTLCALLAAGSVVEHRMVAISHLQALPPTIPDKKPTLTQESIDIAMKMFNIYLPANVEWPKLDLTLEDRGVTIMDGLGMKREVLVGPGAFSSWSVLGSTLAHEIEIHGTQSFLWIRVLNLVGLEGTVMAEREAYMHEIRCARRFGLERLEVQSIEETMNFYYPVGDSEHDSKSDLMGRYL